jgi:putative endonuclease
MQNNSFQSKTHKIIVINTFGEPCMVLYYVYILKCTHQHTGQVSLYTGSTQDLATRIVQHQKGSGAKYTRGKQLDLAYFETHLSRSAAMKRELAIKALSSAQKWVLIEQFQTKKTTGDLS